MENIYLSGLYREQNPSWHEEDSAWKARQIILMLERHELSVRKVGEIGCGVGEILVQLYDQLDEFVELDGFDIAPEAISRAKRKERPRLRFHLADLLTTDVSFDLLLIMDVIEHVPNYLAFLDGCRVRGRYKLYHIPLDIHVSSVLRASFPNYRQMVGHIHYFTQESALAALTATGHRVVDHFLTDGAIELAQLHPSIRRTLTNLLRRLLSRASKRWAARVLGGYSLLVLTE